MPKFTMSVQSKTLSSGQEFLCAANHTSIFVLKGRVDIGGQAFASGEGGYLAHGDRLSPLGGAAEIVQFDLHENANVENVENSEAFEIPDGRAVLRLDQICFPAGAIAYRHVHAGTGYRFLTLGQLEVRADDHAITVGPGDSWFEPANSPVRATNLATAETAFVRAMVLPMNYLGKPTITYLNAEDADKPRLQSNQRFFDQVIELKAT